MNREQRIAAIRETVAYYGHASAYETGSLGFATPGGIRPKFVPEAKLNRICDEAATAGLHVEKFTDKDGVRRVWFTDQSRGPVIAVPSWAASHGW